LRVTNSIVVASVSGIVRTTVVTPDRNDYTSARRGAKQLALAQRVSAVYVYACARCGEIQDREDAQPCCGRVRPMLAVCRPERRRLLLHPAPAPGGTAPSWINVAVSSRPQGQLLAPGVDDLAALVLRRCWEGLQSGAPAVPVRDAVAILRLAHEIEHDAALTERDAARRQIEEWQQELKSGLWAVRSVLDRQYGQDAWAAFYAELKKLRPAAAR
jgi:hypothetical protein